MTPNDTLHIRLGKTYNAAPSKNALCGIAVSKEAGGWPDQNVGVVTCDSDGPWSFDKILAGKSYLAYTKNWCEDCLKQGETAIPLLALKGGEHE